MILALTVTLAAAAVCLPIWFAFSSACSGTFGFHHLQWLATGVLILTGYPMLIRDWAVLTDLFNQAGLPHPAHTAAWAASTLTATIFAFILRPPRRARAALCRALEIPCT